MSPDSSPSLPLPCPFSGHRMLHLKGRSIVPLLETSPARTKSLKGSAHSPCTEPAASKTFTLNPSFLEVSIASKDAGKSRASVDCHSPDWECGNSRMASGCRVVLICSHAGAGDPIMVNRTSPNRVVSGSATCLIMQANVTVPASSPASDTKDNRNVLGPTATVHKSTNASPNTSGCSPSAMAKLSVLRLKQRILKHLCSSSAGSALN
mmetsp:Transcript_136/g.195  ORF Transcript_136/g.195 Transcript_136/m.195 type:complete len:208 (+) Transcript_136:1228-1851(+)